MEPPVLQVEVRSNSKVSGLELDRVEKTSLLVAATSLKFGAHEHSESQSRRDSGKGFVGDGNDLEISVVASGNISISARREIEEEIVPMLHDALLPGLKCQLLFEGHTEPTRIVTKDPPRPIPETQSGPAPILAQSV